MGSYFDDAHVMMVIQRIITASSNFMMTYNNSLEYIRSGCVTIEFGNGRRIELRAPACFWIPGGSMFRFVLTEPDTRAEHMYIDFDGDRSRKMLAALSEACPAGFVHPDDARQFEQSFQEMLRLYRSDCKANRGAIVVQTENLVRLIEDCCNPEIVKNPDRHGIDALAEKLRGNPFSGYDFHVSAQGAGITEDHFRRLFRERYGATPKEYLMRQRMLRAAELLKNTDMRIKEIEFMCGFSSAVEFS
ncbi:MAG: helix-turn-helix domain-containing protein, partial [Victivallaceae bacterium]|nr:helix-turn-helix domain-containing protein [Victivallaceae bacterium]